MLNDPNDPNSEQPVDIRALANELIRSFALTCDYELDTGCSEHCTAITFSNEDLATELQLAVDSSTLLTELWLVFSDYRNINRMFLHYLPAIGSSVHYPLAIA